MYLAFVQSLLSFFFQIRRLLNDFDFGFKFDLIKFKIIGPQSTDTVFCRSESNVASRTGNLLCVNVS